MPHQTHNTSHESHEQIKNQKKKTKERKKRSQVDGQLDCIFLVHINILIKYKRKWPGRVQQTGTRGGK